MGDLTSWRCALRAQRFADLGTAPIIVGPKPALLDVERVICGRAEGGGVRELRACACALCARGVETRSAEGVRGRAVRCRVAERGRACGEVGEWGTGLRKGRWEGVWVEALREGNSTLAVGACEVSRCAR